MSKRVRGELWLAVACAALAGCGATVINPGRASSGSATGASSASTGSAAATSDSASSTTRGSDASTGGATGASSDSGSSGAQSTTGDATSTTSDATSTTSDATSTTSDATSTTGDATSTTGGAGTTTGAAATATTGTSGTPVVCARTAGANGASFVSQAAPQQVEAGSTFTVQVTMRNSGATTWSHFDTEGYYLGSQDPQDNLTWGTNRAFLDPNACVPPGDDYTFSVQLTAPSAAGSYAMRWQMLQDAVEWFGEMSPELDITVAPPSAVPPDAIDLGSTTILNSPDVASWPATAKITRLELRPDGAHVEFTKQDGPESWPDVPFGAPGDSLQYTLWMAVQVGGQWYTSGGIEFWRGRDSTGDAPSQYAADWYYDPGRWGPMATHQPAVGELVGFLVTAGDARNNGSALVQERSNVVLVPFPPDTGGTWTY